MLPDTPVGPPASECAPATAPTGSSEPVDRGATRRVVKRHRVLKLTAAPNTKPGHVYVPCRTCNRPPYRRPIPLDCSDCGGFGYHVAPQRVTE